MAEAKELRFMVEGAGEVCALLRQPAKAHSMLALAHGAGAGMRHAFLEQLADELAKAGVATLRYQFPYMEQHRKSPDKPAVLTAAVQSAARAATQAAPNLPLFAGGKSMGGRMTSEAAAQGLLPGVCGLVFFGFPLHPPKAPSTKRAAHLSKVAIPMLFLQGTRDTLADLALLRPVTEKLGLLATLHVIESADHGFHVPKRSGKTDEQVLTELARTAQTWAEKL